MGCGCLKNKQNQVQDSTIENRIKKVQELKLGKEIEPPSSSKEVQSLSSPSMDLESKFRRESKREYNILDVIQDKLTGNLSYVDNDTMTSRLEICKACDLMKGGLCMKCGCIVEFKVRYVPSSCPQGKW